MRAVASSQLSQSGIRLGLTYTELVSTRYTTTVSVRSLENNAEPTHSRTFAMEPGVTHAYGVAMGLQENGMRLDSFIHDYGSRTANQMVLQGSPAVLSEPTAYHPEMSVEMPPLAFTACDRPLMLTRNQPVGSSGTAPLRVEALP
jgi:hypothetical protein